MNNRSTAPQPKTLEEALTRISELERGLDEAMNLLLQRDARLEFYERRIVDLEEALETRKE